MFKSTVISGVKSLLERAISFLRCPACEYDDLTLAEEPGLRCPACNRLYPMIDGILDLYTGPEIFTPAQRSLQGRFSTWLYERSRWLLAKAVIGRTVAEEVEHFKKVLRMKPGHALLDVACGPANFTIPLARVAHPGLVIGLDISPAQLARARANVAASGLNNVLLVRGDVHRLPLQDGAVAKANCAGGLHQFPDPERALAELARVLRVGGRLSGSTFARHPGPWTQKLQDVLLKHGALHFVDLARLRPVVERAGFAHYRQTAAPVPWFGYYWAERA